MPTVNEIRKELTQEQNAKYKDYQIQRWIDHKGGKKSEIIKTINNQVINEERVKSILADPDRLKKNVIELNRGVLNLIHIPDQRRVMVYINPHLKAPYFDEQYVTDGILLFMYYLVAQIEQLEGDGKQAELVVDQQDTPLPSFAEIKAQLKVFTGVMGRSFPRVFSHMYMCSSWGTWLRSTITMMAHKVGLDGHFVGTEELLVRYGVNNVPNSIGGSLNLESRIPTGTVLQQFYLSDPPHPCNRLFKPEALNDYLQRGPSMMVHNDELIEPDLLWSTVMVLKELDLPVQPNATNNNLLTTLHHIPPIVAYIAGMVPALVVGGPYWMLVVMAAILYSLRTYTPLWSRSVDIEGSQMADRLRAHVLDQSYKECMDLLEPMSLCVDAQPSTFSKAKMRSYVGAFSLTLSDKDKANVKKCIKKVIEVIEMVPAVTVPCPGGRPEYQRWVELYRLLRAITTSNVACICGCGQEGNMDFLDRHLKHGTPQYKKACESVSKGLTYANPPMARAVLRSDSNNSRTRGNSNNMDGNSNRRSSLLSLNNAPVAMRRTTPPKNNITSPTGSEPKRCAICRHKFTLLRRRRYCYLCGVVICAKCSAIPIDAIYRRHPRCVCLRCEQRFPEGKFVPAADLTDFTSEASD